MRHTLQPARFLSTLLASAAIASVSLTVSVQPADAFLDRIFGGRPVEEPQPVQPDPAPVLDKAVIAANKVSAPKYYTYKADQLTAFKLKALAVRPEPPAAQMPVSAAPGQEDMPQAGELQAATPQAVTSLAGVDQTVTIGSPAVQPVPVEDPAAQAFDDARPAFAGLRV